MNIPRALNPEREEAAQRWREWARARAEARRKLERLEQEQRAARQRQELEREQRRQEQQPRPRPRHRHQNPAPTPPAMRAVKPRSGGKKPKPAPWVAHAADTRPPLTDAEQASLRRLACSIENLTPESSFYSQCLDRAHRRFQKLLERVAPEDDWDLPEPVEGTGFPPWSKYAPWRNQ